MFSLNINGTPWHPLKQTWIGRAGSLSEEAVFVELPLKSLNWQCCVLATG